MSKLQPFEILLWSGERRTVKGYALTENFFARKDEDGWVISHLGSGGNVNGLFDTIGMPKSLAECRAAAKALEPLFDWKSVRCRGKRIVNHTALKRSKPRLIEAVAAVLT